MLESRINRTDTKLKHHTIVGAKAANDSGVSCPKVGKGGT